VYGAAVDAGKVEAANSLSTWIPSYGKSYSELIVRSCKRVNRACTVAPKEIRDGRSGGLAVLLLSALMLWL
jgi:hypothetical protein